MLKGCVVSETFGGMFNRLRVASKQTLRSFCLKHGYDPGNISKLERGLMAAPENGEVLTGYALALGLKRGSSEWTTFTDLASAERGKLPADLMSDAELVSKLPLLFRSMREAAPLTKKTLRDFAEEIRRQ
jgi:hypothetical protein